MAPKKDIKRKRSYRSKKTTAKKAPISTAVKTFVQQSLSRQIESKEIVAYGFNIDILTVASSTPTNICLLPEPSQGTGQSDRVGNEIKIKNLYVKGFVNLKPYDSTTNPTAPTPLMVKLWVISAKNVNTNTLSNTAVQDYFSIANNSVGFNANIRDQLLPVNQDMFKVHASKVFKIGVGAPSTYAGTTSSSAYLDNSPMIHPFSFDCSKYVSTLRFDESQTWATNKNLFLVVTATRCDGVTTSATLAPCEWHYMVQTKYHDA